jgi:hypothetical protein
MIELNTLLLLASLGAIVTIVSIALLASRRGAPPAAGSPMSDHRPTSDGLTLPDETAAMIPVPVVTESPQIVKTKENHEC